MKEKIVDSICNAAKVLTSKRAYVLGGLAYLAVTDMSDHKFGWVCALGIAYIVSETVKKLRK